MAGPAVPPPTMMSMPHPSTARPQSSIQKLSDSLNHHFASSQRKDLISSGSDLVSRFSKLEFVHSVKKLLTQLSPLRRFVKYLT
jgi:hypothetical protein